MISAINYQEYIYLNMHMEQVYSDFINKNDFNHMKSTDITYETIKRLEAFLKDNHDKKIVLDFQGDKLKQLQNNMKKSLNACITSNVYVINVSNELKKELNVRDLDKSENIADYYTVFEKFKYNYVIELREDKAYECTNGVLLSKYINMKKLIEDNAKFFKWCYLLCDNLMQNGLFNSLTKDSSSKPILLAHTLNGVCIATMISRMLNLEMIYVDHLGPYNRLTGIKFPENFQSYHNYLLVVDFICQGNEILRAQNIVEFIGGKYMGFIGMIKLDISQISAAHNNEKIIKETVLRVSAKDAVEQLEYTIKTKLCCNKGVT